MKLAKLTTLAAVASLLALPAFAADTVKADAGKPAAKAVSAPAHKTTKKAATTKATKVKKANKSK